MDAADETNNSKPRKFKRRSFIKIVLRRLPPAMTKEELQKQIDPLPELDLFEFVPPNPDTEKKYAFSRSYFVFKNDQDIIPFKDRFNKYHFIDSEGNESVALVELAPNQRVHSMQLQDSKKRDRKCDTLESDYDYKNFLEAREESIKPKSFNMEKLLKEIEAREKSSAESSVQETPLTQYLSMKDIEAKQRRLMAQKADKKKLDKRPKESTKKTNSNSKTMQFVNSRFRNSDLPNHIRDRGRAYRDDEDKRVIDEKGKFASSDRSKKEIRKDKTDLIEKINGKVKHVKAFTEGSHSSKKAILENLETLNKEKSAENSVMNGSKSNEKKESETGRNENKTTAENTETTPRHRRNKDRPERPIYRPDPARRRAAKTKGTSESNDNA